MGKGILGTGYYPLSSSWTLWSVSILIVSIVLVSLIWSWRKGYFNNLQQVAIDILDENR